MTKSAIDVPTYEYWTAPSETIHLVRVARPKSRQTACGLALPTRRKPGEQTLSGVQATCGTCKRAAGHKTPKKKAK